MEEFIKVFGLNPILILAQIVNFLIIFFILKKFLYKQIMSVLKKRKDAIEEGLKQAEEARLLLEKAAKKEKEILKQGREEVQRLIDEAKKQNKAFLDESEQKAKIKEQYILDEARKQIALEVNQVETELYKKVSSMALEMIQKSKTALFNEEDQELAMRHAIQEIKKREQILL
jgi:F-type H+-transporting ATPase subunit b